MQNIKSQSAQEQGGASLVEFLIAAPILLMTGLGTLQAGMLYHSKSIVNYATFEAARVGATNHAMPEPMKKELGIRLAPLYGGDGTMKKAAVAMARSAAEIDLPINLDGSIAPVPDIKIMNPTLESFEKWGVDSLEVSNRTAIPNSHLKHNLTEDDGEGTEAMTLADANLLKIQVTYGVELKIPFVNKLILETMKDLELMSGAPDLVKLAYYEAGRIPVTASATVRMQSEAWKEGIELANAEPPAVNPADPSISLVPDSEGEPFTPVDPIAGDPIAGDPGDCNRNGLVDLVLQPKPVELSCPGAGGSSEEVGSEGSGSGGASCA